MTWPPKPAPQSPGVARVRPIALVDLDDTLFQTLRKCPADVPRERLTVMAVARDGAPVPA